MGCKEQMNVGRWRSGSITECVGLHQIPVPNTWGASELMLLGVSSRRVANGLSGNMRYLFLWQPIAFPKLHSVISKYFMQPSSFQLLLFYFFAKTKTTKQSVTLTKHCGEAFRSKKKKKISLSLSHTHTQIMNLSLSLSHTHKS